MKKIILSLSIALLPTFYAFSQGAFNCLTKVEESQMPFAAGEHLEYTVSYSAAVVKADIATVTIKTWSEIYAGVECYRVNAVGRTKDFYSVFFELYDVYDSWIEKSTLRPLRQETICKEGGYNYHSIFRYDWPNKRVYTWGKNLNKSSQENYTLNLKDCTYDPMAMFTNLRASDLSKLKMGVGNTVNIVLQDKILTIKFKLLGREVLYVPRIGNLNTLKFSCELVNADGKSFPDGSEFYLWVSDDKNKLPLHIESPIRVGKVKVTLYSYRGLKHPLASLIIKK